MRNVSNNSSHSPGGMKENFIWSTISMELHLVDFRVMDGVFYLGRITEGQGCKSVSLNCTLHL